MHPEVSKELSELVRVVQESKDAIENMNESLVAVEFYIQNIKNASRNQDPYLLVIKYIYHWLELAMKRFNASKHSEILLSFMRAYFRTLYLEFFQTRMNYESIVRVSK